MLVILMGDKGERISSCVVGLELMRGVNSILMVQSSMYVPLRNYVIEVLILIVLSEGIDLILCFLCSLKSGLMWWDEKRRRYDMKTVALV
jgi:hypothetical protein